MASSTSARPTTRPTAQALTLAEAHVRGADLVARHTDRFIAYAAALTDEQLRRRVPGSAWTAGETLTHVESVYGRYTTDLRRAPSVTEMAVQNTDDVTHLGLDRDRSVASITEHLATLTALVHHIEPDRRFPFHGGQETTFAGGWGNLLGELLAHGDDLARATGAPFAIPGDDLEIMWRFTSPLLGAWLRAECSELADTWELRFPFGSRWALFGGGAITWHDEMPSSAPARTIATDDAAEFALAFPYRRRAITDPELALFAARFHDL